MFPYTVKYTASEHDIQTNDLLYKIDPKCQNAFEFLEKTKRKKKKETFEHFKK